MVKPIENSFIGRHTQVAADVAYKSFLTNAMQSVNEFFHSYPKTTFMLGVATGSTLGYIAGLSIGTMLGIAIRSRILK